MSEWTKLPAPPKCDLCNRVASWQHAAGGLRCHLCPRPGQDGENEAEEPARVGLCSACKRETALTPTGLIMKHSAPGRYDRCPGSKHRPLDRGERGDAA